MKRKGIPVFICGFIIDSAALIVGDCLSQDCLWDI